MQPVVSTPQSEARSFITTGYSCNWKGAGPMVRQDAPKVAWEDTKGLSTGISHMTNSA